MAEVFALGASIAGVVGVTLQIAQIVVQFGPDWKDAPQDAKSFMAELGSLSSVLSATTNLLLNPDFIEAFQDQPSLLESELNGNAASITGTKEMTKMCKTHLEELLADLNKRIKRKDGAWKSWERLKGALGSKSLRTAVQSLRGKCEALNRIVSIDTAVIAAKALGEIRRTREDVKGVKGDVKGARDEQRNGFGQLHNYNAVRESREEYERILSWLTPKATLADNFSQQNDIISRRQEGTGQWFLDSREFKDWITGTRQTLFCPGLPGAGKTIMTSIVVEHLYSLFRKNSTVDVGIAYLYCDYRQQTEQTPRNLLTSVIKQLIQGQSSIPEDVKLLYNQHKDGTSQPYFEEFSKALCSVVTGYSKTFIVVDGLDECQACHRRKFLSEIFKIQAHTATNIFATSRTDLEIQREFEGSITLEIRARAEDVKKYLEDSMSQLPSFVSRQAVLQEEIVDSVIKASDGIFLLAELHMRSLEDKTNPRAVKTALERLPNGSDAYDESYCESMNRIKSQREGLQDLAIKAMSWITCARRLITTQELRHALAVEPNTTEFDDNNLVELEQIVSVCVGLVTVDEESGIVRFVHYTTQEYFERTWQDWCSEAHFDITIRCITYLSYKEFQASPCDDFTLRLQKYPFYRYAADYWGEHTRLVAWAELEEFVLALLKNDALVAGATQALRFGKLNGDIMNNENSPLMFGVHIAAIFGLRDGLPSLISSGYTADVKDGSGRTPLSWAAGMGHEEIVELFLQRIDVDPNSVDRRGCTPLNWAARGGHEKIMMQLLDIDDNDFNKILSGQFLRIFGGNFKREHGETPLAWCAKHGHLDMVEGILTWKNVDANAKDETGRTPLSWAALNGHSEVVDVLLSYILGRLTCDPEPGIIPVANRTSPSNPSLTMKMDVLYSTDKDGRTPLIFAAARGHLDIVKKLLSFFEDAEDVPDLADRYGQTALAYAAKSGHEGVVHQLLSERWVSLSFEDEMGRTPLQLAVENGQTGVVQQFLTLRSPSVDLSHKDKQGRTLLHRAVAKGHESIVELLLASGRVDPNTLDNLERTPLECAIIHNQKEAFKRLLLTENIDLNVKDSKGRTLLHHTALEGNEIVAKQLLATGMVEYNAMDNRGWTPLHYATQKGHEKVVQLLLEVDGINPNCIAAGQWNQTPLHRAALRGEVGIVRYLLSTNSIDLNSVDEHGQTPLYKAILSGNEEIVKLLLDTGKININHKDQNRKTLLHKAVFKGNEAIVKRLLTTKGIDPNLVNNAGLRPVDHAIFDKRGDIIKLFGVLETGAI